MSPRSVAKPGAVVGVAASAGGVAALTAFIRALPGDFPGAVLVVLHLSDTGPSVLPDILARNTPLTVVPAHEGMALRRGLVVVAPPGQHLRVRGGGVALDAGPRENGHRPSADALFRSLAESWGRRAAGIVLSGTMDDGAAGLRVIGHAHGLTVVQDPAEADFPGMPRAAIAEAAPALVCPVAEMGEKLVAWMGELGPAEEEADPYSEDGPAGATMSTSELSEFTCPECGGTLWLDGTYGAERYRCRVGHTFSPDGLLVGKQDALEAALWAAIVAIEERADVSRRLLRRLEGRISSIMLQRYRDDITQAAGRIAILRGLIDELLDEGPLVGRGDDGSEGHGADATTA